MESQVLNGNMDGKWNHRYSMERWMVDGIIGTQWKDGWQMEFGLSNIKLPNFAQFTGNRIQDIVVTVGMCAASARE